MRATREHGTTAELREGALLDGAPTESAQRSQGAADVESGAPRRDGESGEPGGRRRRDRRRGRGGDRGLRDGDNASADNSDARDADVRHSDASAAPPHVPNEEPTWSAEPATSDAASLAGDEPADARHVADEVRGAHAHGLDDDVHDALQMPLRELPRVDAAAGSHSAAQDAATEIAQPAAPSFAPSSPSPTPEIAVARLSLELPSDSGLVMIETSRERVHETTEETVATFGGRTRPPRTNVAAEPLEMVETRKEPSPPPA